MSQHFLLSPKARTLGLKAIMGMSDDKAHEVFCELRWPKTQGEPVCPHCGSLTIYRLKKRRTFRCKDCAKDFTVTSGTIFASRKLAIRDYLLAIVLFLRGAKGRSAIDLSFSLNVDYKTAFVLAHKLREVLGSTFDGMELRGEVEIDGAEFGNYVKHPNRRADRKDLRLAENRSPLRQFVIVARERSGRAMTSVALSESEGKPFVFNHVRKGSKLYRDEGSGWSGLDLFFDVETINHSVEYANGSISTNQAESFFSRLRRAEIGVHHSISKGYLDAYAAEMAWRENNRRESDGAQLVMLGGSALNHSVSRKWAGYWQRGPAFNLAS